MKLASLTPRFLQQKPLLPALLHGCLAALRPALGVTAVCLGVTGLAQGFRIHDAELLEGKPLRIRYPSRSDSYYILWRGESPEAIRQPAAMALGQVGESEVSVPEESANRPHAFFLLEQVPQDQARDTDGDGIDDVWELRFRRAGASLVGGDAGLDHDGNGSPDSADYQQPAARFASTQVTIDAEQNLVRNIQVRLSKPYSGPVSVLVGGTAIAGEDYQLSGLDSWGSTAQVAASGMTVDLRLTVLSKPSIQPDRYVTLSLLQPPSFVSQGYRISSPAEGTCLIRITDGSMGFYGGTLVLGGSGGLNLGGQPIRLGIRPSAAGGFEAILDATESSFVSGRFKAPVSLEGEAGAPRFLAPCSGTVPGSLTGRTPAWLLYFDNPKVEAGQIIYPVLARFTGLSASPKPVTVSGTMTVFAIGGGSPNVTP